MTDQKTLTKKLKKLSSSDLVILKWHLQRRKEQTCPEPTPTIWFLLGGRGGGKTYSAANHIYDYSCNLPFVPENKIVYVALIGSVFDDVKNTMVEGRSGLLNIIPDEDLIAWNRTVGELKYKVIGPNGEYREVRCLSFTSEKPDKLRGPNTHIAWIDEYAKFKDSNIDPTQAGTTWNNMMLGLRLGTKPHVIVTGTPTPCKLTKYLLSHSDCKMTRMRTQDNRQNLPQSFLDELDRLHPGSRTYRQEVLAEVLFDNPDAIFDQDRIDANRADIPEEEEKVYKVLGYDPAASSAAAADECGLVLCAYTPEVKSAVPGQPGRPRIVKPVHAYVLKDLSGHFTPHEQCQRVIKTMLDEKVSDLVFEQNQGVEFVMTALEQALKDNVLQYSIRKEKKSKRTDYGIVKRFRVSGVDLDSNPFKFMIFAVHAVKGKQLRAEMASSRYDSGQIHHPVDPSTLPFCEISTCEANLEFQMTSWDPVNTKSSPDRLDALVYCMLHIFAGFMLTNNKVTIARPGMMSQAQSRHEAVRKNISPAGIYSMDLHRGGAIMALENSNTEDPFMERKNGSHHY